MGKAIDFDPEDIRTIAQSVLSFPYLHWNPVDGRLPCLTVRHPATGVPLVTYEILAILGSGSFGVVFLGETVSEGEADRSRVAIKVPSVRLKSSGSGSTGVDSEFAERVKEEPDLNIAKFEERVKKQCRKVCDDLKKPILRNQVEKFSVESQMMLRLNHPGVVHMVSTGLVEFPAVPAGEDPEQPCIVMDFVDGSTVREKINAEHPWQLKDHLVEAIEFGRDVALALATIHDQKACHRDLSWNNVIIRSKDGRPVVIDLGNVLLPDVIPEASSELVVNGDILMPFVPFTHGFAAPEHRDGTKVIDGRADQFSLGVILYVWYSGKEPATKKTGKTEKVRWPYDPRTGSSNDTRAPDTPVLLHKLRQSIVRTWSEDQRRTFRGFAEIVQRMIHHRREDRYPSMRDVAAEFQLLLESMDPENHDVPSRAEAVVDDRYNELCRQLSRPARTIEGCLFLQSLVLLARLQLEVAIRYIWDTVYQTWSDADLSPIDKAIRFAYEIPLVEAELKHSLNVVLRAFGERSMQASAAPRFGGQFQSILNLVSVERDRTFVFAASQLGKRAEAIRKNSIQQPVDASDNAATDQNVDSSSQDSLTAEAVDSQTSRSSLRTAEQEIADHVEEIWTGITEWQGHLAEIDYKLAIYSRQLKNIC